MGLHRQGLSIRIYIKGHGGVCVNRQGVCVNRQGVCVNRQGVDLPKSGSLGAQNNFSTYEGVAQREHLEPLELRHRSDTPPAKHTAQVAAGSAAA